MALQIHLLPNDEQPYQTPPPPTLTNSKSHHCRPSSLASTRSKPFLSLFLLTLTHITLSVLLFCTTPTTAQAPTPRRRTAYAQTPNNTRLYIQGGLPIGTGYTPEFNELDLTKPWPTSAPAWSLLPPGLPNYRHAMVYVKPEHSAGLGGASAGSQGYLLSIGGNTVPGINFWAYYNIQTQQWTPLTTPPAPYPGLEGPTAVSDPNTGLVYVIGGFWNLDGTLATTLKITNFMTVIDPTQSIGTRIVSQTPATGLNNLTGAVAVWSTMRRSVLVFGGSRAVALADIAGLQMTSIDEYDPVRGTWGTMLTSGPSLPGARADACAVASEDGSKIVVFGGELNVASFLSSIYVLDVATQIWKRGPDVPTPWSQSACAYHDGQFIVFGGTASQNMSVDMHTTQPLVFDVQTLLWVQQFTPKEVSSPNGGGNATGDGGASGTKKSDIGLIVGCAFGGFVVLLGAMVGVLFIRGRRERRRRDGFLAGDNHTRRPDGAAITPREGAAFIHPNGGAGAGGGVVKEDDDEDDYPPFHRPRSPPGPPTNNYHPYKPFTPTEYYPSAYGYVPTVAPAPVPAAGPTAFKDTEYYPVAFGSAPSTGAAVATAKGVPIMAAAAVTSSSGPVSASSHPASTSPRPASFTTTTAHSDPSFYYKQVQAEADKPYPQPPAPPQPQLPRSATYMPPRTPYTPSYSPSYSDNTDSTIPGYVSTIISPPAHLTVDLPPPIPRRPPSGSGYYSMASVEDTTAPVASMQQQQQQKGSPSPSAPGPQYRGDEHAQYQEQIYQAQQQQQHQYYSQHQQPYQQPYRQPSPNSGQYRHSTATAEEHDILSPQPSSGGYNESHGQRTDDRRRYAAPQAVRDVPVETYRDYKVEAPRQPQMRQGSFH